MLDVVEKVRSVEITGVAVYHPENEVDNGEYVEYFKNRGMDITHMFEVLGKERRYILSDERENSLTMGFEAAKRVLDSSSTLPSEIDIVVFVSDMPEYFSPSNAVFLHKWLGLKQETLVFDMNQNCTGMITALDVIGTYLRSNKRYKKALLVSAFSGSRMGRKDTPVGYGVFGDGAGAIVLEACEYEEQRGLVASYYKTNSVETEKMVYPEVGFSNVYHESTTMDQRLLKWAVETDSFIPGEFEKALDELAGDLGIEVTAFDHLFVSQISLGIIHEVSNLTGISIDRFTYVGDRFGYTGNSSPVFTMEEALRTGKIVRGQYVVLLSIGAGHTVCGTVFKF